MYTIYDFIITSQEREYNYYMQYFMTSRGYKTLGW